MISATMTRLDTDIQQSVLEELKWDTRVDETRIGVQVREGVVTLTGTVHCYAVKQAAQEAALTVVGVRDVVNNIEVRVPNREFRADIHITRAAQQILDWDALLPRKQIRALAANGWVILEGTVTCLSERRRAERLVSSLIGMRGVVNRIRVHAPETPPQDTRQAIEKALNRRAHCREAPVRVEVQESVASLMGRVPSLAEREAILEVASHAPGIQEIEDCLRIDPCD